MNAKASTSGTAQTQKGPKGRKRGHSGTSDVQAEAGGEAEVVGPKRSQRLMKKAGELSGTAHAKVCRDGDRPRLRWP